MGSVQTKTGGRKETSGLIPGDYALSVGKPKTPAPKNWRWIKLTDISRLETGHTPSRKHPEYWGGDIPWVGIRDATGNHGKTLYKTNQYTNDLGIRNSSARILPKNTVCLSRTASVGYVVVMGKPMSTSQDFVNWVCDPEKLDYRYLKYVLLGEKRSFLRFASGTTHQTIYFPEVKAFHICLPPLEEQRSIAHILGTLDDKIELNCQMNETLEAMAQALFKSWFVDFDPVIDNALAAGNEIPEPLRAKAAARQAQAAQSNPPQPLRDHIRQQFPDAFEYSGSMGWIPEGWCITTMDDATSLIIDHRGKTPKKLGGDWSESGYPAISAKNVKSRKLVRPDTIRFVDEDMYTKWMKEPLQQGDIALTSEAPLGELYYFTEKYDYLLSQRLYGIRANKKNCTGSYLFFWLQTDIAKSDLEGRATGTTVIGIRQAELRKVNVLCPREGVIRSFSELVDSYLLRISKNDSQNDELANLRDTLLPKLLSGELRIPEAESLLKDAM